MMTKEEFELLISSEAQSLIKQHLQSDPLKFALSFKSKTLPVNIISTQLKYLQRASSKLPSYYKAQCIIPPLSYEQSSSEAAAALKDYSGKNCLDLTCGLGVDSYYFSKKFEKVTSLELQPVLAAITNHNFAKLHAPNINVINQSAEDFLAQNTSARFDLIFVDPARRDDTKNRVFLFEDCSPNLYEILPLVKSITQKLVVKASPLFDNVEAWRRFPELSNLAVVSVDNECKEVLLEFDFIKSTESKKDIILLNRKNKTYRFTFNKAEIATSLPLIEDQFPNYLLEPDVAFYKSRLNNQFFNNYYSFLNVSADVEDGYFYTNNKDLADFPGRSFKIVEILDYQPKTLKKELKQKSITKANISKRNFPVSVDELKKTLNIADGGSVYLFFTKTKSGKLKVLITEKRT